MTSQRPSPAPAPPLAAEGTSPVRPDVTSFGCEAPNARGLIGQPASAALGAQALQLTGARAIRWIRPGDAVTMDYRDDRLNIELDAAGRVKMLRCG